ncbi:hypothetical protein [Undibacterium sp. TJN19]|uniref:hypothetical protein n=1 Tax=Undibacterium sp. TJN19 TaxID=3413055 RepID=UPI003BF31CB3
MDTTTTKNLVTGTASSEFRKPMMVSKRPMTRRSDFRYERDSCDGASTLSFWLEPGQYQETETRSNMIAGFTIGAVVGGAIGAIVATLAVLISPFRVPGLDLLVTHPLNAATTGTILGTLIGSTIGLLLAWGVSGQHLQNFESSLTAHSDCTDPIRDIETVDKSREDVWKRQHGEYANI